MIAQKGEQCEQCVRMSPAFKVKQAIQRSVSLKDYQFAKGRMLNLNSKTAPVGLYKITRHKQTGGELAKFALSWVVMPDFSRIQTLFWSC